VINEQIYKRTLRLKSASVISGVYEKEVEVGDESLPWELPIIAAFIADDELQEMTICSTNIGFVKTLRKFYRD
jgi:hypothetical protein